MPPPFPPPARNWWQGNWPWAVPTSCLVLLLAAVVFGGDIVWMVFRMMKSSDVYQTAVRRAETSAQVAEALGSPLTESWWMTGNINVTPQTGNTNLTIPIAGPKGKGTIYVIATKTEGEWMYPRMDLSVDGTGRRIELLPR